MLRHVNISRDSCRLLDNDSSRVINLLKNVIMILMKIVVRREIDWQETWDDACLQVRV
jgi:hypothetical protein